MHITGHVSHLLMHSNDLSSGGGGGGGDGGAHVTGHVLHSPMHSDPSSGASAGSPRATMADDRMGMTKSQQHSHGLLEEANWPLYSICSGHSSLGTGSLLPWTIG